MQCMQCVQCVQCTVLSVFSVLSVQYLYASSNIFLIIVHLADSVYPTMSSGLHTCDIADLDGWIMNMDGGWWWMLVVEGEVVPDRP